MTGPDARRALPGDAPLLLEMMAEFYAETAGLYRKFGFAMRRLRLMTLRLE